MITFCTLFSGSSGNAVYFATDQGALLVDCGMSGRQVLDALCAAGLDPAGLKALLITHEHSDHVKGVGVLSRRLGLPVYATEGTWQGMDSAVGELAPQHRIVIRAGESFFLNDLEIAPFSIPHDAADPVGYRIFARDHSVAVATDLGYFSQDVRDALTGADLVLLESNPDPDLLLGHLSSENNTPDLAYRTTHAALTDAGAQVGADVTLHVAARYRASYLYTMA